MKKEDFEVYYPDIGGDDMFYKTSQEEFDYDMVFVTQFYDGKLWVVWKEAVTGNTLTSEFEEIGYKPEYPVA